ncbi:unnamed protein product [Effrenium voratum]|uniref:XRRM domain-containing protein n=1 Tax=Effrenium voratum TaxID=2562239 RepID=A0AA36N9Y2_9DINO|nr:unnamed protein product [Effrenium voratum]
MASEDSTKVETDAAAEVKPEAKEAEDTEPAPEEGEAQEQLEVSQDQLDWFTGPGGEALREIERLSGAGITVAEAVDGRCPVKIRGKTVAVSRAKVLLEDKLRAPGSERPVIVIAGRSFKDREELVSHIRALQAATPDGKLLGPEDAFFVFHLATFHPNFMEKMTAPVVGFKYGPHEAFVGSKCFFVVRADGSEEGISIMKCVEVALPRKGTGRGVKRDREEEDVKDREEEREATRPKREIQTGCVLIIEGLPGSASFEEVKEALKEFGDVRFVEFLRDGPPAFEAKEVKEGSPAETEKPDTEKPDTETPAKEEAKEGAPAETEKPDTEKPDTEMPAKEETKEPDCEAAEAAEPEEEDEVMCARARFADAAGAAAAAQGFKEFDGKTMVCRVIDGDEERRFWERLWQKADAKSKGKGKGKWGKDWGKDWNKGKGKKGKGKGKHKFK